MGVYGGIESNQDNIRFPFDLALPAAADLWALAERISTLQGHRSTGATDARKDWEGPHRQTFDGHIDGEVADTENVAGGLRTLANSLASQWAEARGEQNRINWARWVESEIEDDNWGEDAVEHFSGEDDYGDPPPDPGVPGAPDFSPTTGVLHPEFGP